MSIEGCVKRSTPYPVLIVRGLTTLSADKVRDIMKDNPGYMLADIAGRKTGERLMLHLPAKVAGLLLAPGT